MQGDFSLDPFAYRDRVTRVLAQQGRVQLDSDWNEQTESLLRFLRGLAIDVIGHHGGVADSFKIQVTGGKAFIRWGEYYVDGIRCVNFPDGFDIFDVLDGITKAPTPLSLTDQRDGFLPPNFNPFGTDSIIFYLDVYERHVSSAQDDSIREVALMGPDTASRAVIVWRVLVVPAKDIEDIIDQKKLVSTLPKEYDPYYVALNLYFRTHVRLRAQAVINESTDPCIISPDARYRGVDNRLFRVEIHNTPAVGSNGKTAPATFKWSADNGSIVYPIRGTVDGKTVHLESMGRDDRTAICVNDWVEVVDDRILITGAVGASLLQVVDVRTCDMTVILNAAPEKGAGSDENLHPILRRWAGPLIKIQEATALPANWVALADGVEVQFSTADPKNPRYRTGDYWLIPARTATGDVIWPHNENSKEKEPLALPPHGIGHHYAPLAKWAPSAGGAGNTNKPNTTPPPPTNGTNLTDLRWTFEPMAEKVKPGS